MLTRKALADAIDAYDDEITALQDSKRETYAEYRDELADRMGKDEIKVELEATKAAIKRRRAIREKGEETVDHRDALVDEIFTEITAARAPRATRVENIEQFDAETGEIIEPADPASAGAAADGGSENAPATVDTLHPQPASLAGLPGATAPGERIKEPAHSDLSEVGAVGEGGRAALAVAAEPGGEGGQANAFPAARVMSMTPLEPRTAGGLKGFGFTVSFDERPVVAGGVQVPFEGAINT